MASQLDAAVHVGVEDNYGDRAEPDRSFEAQEDVASRDVEHLESPGRRAGMQTLRADRRRVINHGASGTFTVDVLTKGFGRMLKAALGDSTIDGTEQTHTTKNLEPGDSLTVQVVRPEVGGELRAWDYLGGIVSEFNLSQENDGLLVAELELDFQDEQKADSIATASYPDGVPFGWPDCTLTLDGQTLEQFEEFSLSWDWNLKTGRRFLRGNELKKRPIVQGPPEGEGELVGEFAGLDVWEAFKDGSVLELKAEWEHDGATLAVRLPAVQFNGSTPQIQEDDVAQQEAGFRILDPGGDEPAIEITYTTDDEDF